MKKIIYILLVFVVFPLNTLAYSKYIIPGGETLGIEIDTKGILVVGFYQTNGKYNKGNPIIKSGDYITHINNEKVNSINNMTKIIEENINNKVVEITINRNNEVFNSMLEIIEENDIYKTGLYVKDSILGIGTLTYIDPNTKIYGALGHEIIESKTNSVVEIKSGKIFQNYINSIEKSYIGHAGSKNAKFYYNNIYGNINKNTNYGIYGIYKKEIPKKDLVEVGTKKDIKIGKANIYTVLENEKIEEFEINITSINDGNNIKNISFEILDNNLLDKTGGIVQGMSGSPIIQNGRIIGAVTHVITDNPSTGYGIYITTMLEEGEK